jgi:hypothetical protein
MKKIHQLCFGSCHYHSWIRNYAKVDDEGNDVDECAKLSLRYLAGSSSHVGKIENTMAMARAGGRAVGACRTSYLGDSGDGWWEARSRSFSHLSTQKFCLTTPSALFHRSTAGLILLIFDGIIIIQRLEAQAQHYSPYS